VNENEALDANSVEKSNQGGARPGAGRKPGWFREEARKALAGEPPYSKNKLEYLSKVANGEEKHNGEDIAVRDRLKAIEMLGKWAALETVKIEGGDDGTPININPYSGITNKADLATLEEILKRAGTTASTAPKG
jgi:hypothetical protein